MAKIAEATASERAYHGVKARVFSGELHLKQHLDVAAIARDLGISTTPVREALVRLTAESIVAVRPAKGFFVALWTASKLRDLYLWRGMLSALALDAPVKLKRAGSALSYVERTANVFAALEEGANAELVHAARNADDRLYRARTAEPDALKSAEADIAALENALEASDPNKRKKAFRTYHHKRACAAARIREHAVWLALGGNGEK